MRIINRKVNQTVESAVDTAVDRTATTLSDKIRAHWDENRKVYAAVIGGVVVGSILNHRNQIVINIAPPTVQLVDDRPVIVAAPAADDTA